MPSFGKKVLLLFFISSVIIITVCVACIPSLEQVHFLELSHQQVLLLFQGHYHAFLTFLHCYWNVSWNCGKILAIITVILEES